MPEHILSKLYKTARRLPDKIAFADESGALTFEGMYRACCRTRAFLEAQELHAEPVVICMEKTHAFAAAIFGVLGGGCVYVPLEADTTANRMAAVLEATKARAVICDDTTHWLAKSACKEAEAEIRMFLWEDVCAYETDVSQTEPAGACVSGEDSAYIMFTSGSTGTPKGVCVTHANLDAYVSRLIAVMGFSRETVFANQTPFSTDASLKELFPTVWLGATTWIIPKMCFSFPATLISFLNEHRVNTICWAASAYALTAGMGALAVAAPEYIKTASFGSEALAAGHLRVWMEACPGAHFTNLYGPTETTGVCCYNHVDALPEPGSVIPAGTPFPDAVITVRDETGNCLEDGETGEVWIAGPQVAKGYAGDETLTRERFVTGKNGMRCYRTGDTGFFDKTGQLVLTGRTDFQIKHMGYRIEPAEIETQGYGLSGVTMCGCVYDKAEHQIVFCYTGDAGEHDVRQHLKEKLPRRMQPARYLHLDIMPLNANGKADRLRLLEIISRG